MIIVHYEGKSGQELEAETSVEPLEEYCLMTYSLWLAKSTFYTPLDHLHRHDTTPNGLGPYQLAFNPV